VRLGRARRREVGRAYRFADPTSLAGAKVGESLETRIIALFDAA
jgi:hypothetical protein